MTMMMKVLLLLLPRSCFSLSMSIRPNKRDDDYYVGGGGGGVVVCVLHLLRNFNLTTLWELEGEEEKEEEEEIRETSR